MYTKKKTRYVPDMLIFPFVPPYSSFYQMNQLHFTDYPLEVTKIKNGKVTENETYFYKLLTADSKSLVKDKVSILGKHADAATYQGLHNVGNELVADVSNIPATTYRHTTLTATRLISVTKKTKQKLSTCTDTKANMQLRKSRTAITNQLQDYWGMILSKDWQTQRSPAIQTCRKLKI